MLFACLYGSLCLLLTIPNVQSYLCGKIEVGLSKLLDTSVTIGQVDIEPLNSLALYDVVICDQKQAVLLDAKKIAASFKIHPLMRGRIEINNIQLNTFSLSLKQATPHTPLNAQFIIDVLANPKEPLRLKVQIHNAVMRSGRVGYDIESEPYNDRDLFDANHIELSHLNSTLSLKSLTSDSTNVFVKNLSFKERSGFDLRKLSIRIDKNSQRAKLTNLELQLPQSAVSLGTTYIDLSEVTDKSQLADKAKLDMELTSAQISLSELAPFVPEFENHTTQLHLSGRVLGTLYNLTFPYLKASDEEKNIDIEGKMSIEDMAKDSVQTHIQAELSRFYCTRLGVKRLAAGFFGENSPMEQKLTQLGVVDFTGRLSGYMPSFEASGVLQTDLGMIKTDLKMSSTQREHELAFKGSVATPKFAFGELLEVGKGFGTVAFDLHVDGVTQADASTTGRLDGQISSLEINGYNYNKIAIDGHYDSDSCRVSVEVDDPNGYLLVGGSLLGKGRSRQINCDVKANDINLNALKLIERGEDMNLSFLLQSHFTGSSLDRGRGELLLQHASCITPTQQADVPYLRVCVENDQHPQRMYVESDLIAGEVKGEYNFTTLPHSLQRAFATLFPSIQSPKYPDTQHNKFAFDLKLGRSDKLTELLRLPVHIQANSEVEGAYDDTAETLLAHIDMPRVKLGEMVVNDAQVRASMAGGNAKLTVRGNAYSRKNHILNMASLQLHAQSDSAWMRATWSNESQSTYCAHFASHATLTPHANGSYAINVGIEPSQAILNDSVWNIAPTTIQIDSGRVVVNDFAVRHQGQYLQVGGYVSKSPTDSLLVQLKGVSLDNIFEILNVENLTLGGEASGDVQMYSLLEIPSIETNNLVIDRFTCNAVDLGRLQLQSNWDNSEEGFHLLGYAQDGEDRVTHVDGYIYPVKDSISMNFDAQSLDIAFVQPFVKDIAEDISGRATGKMKLFGNFERLNLDGDAYMRDLKFGIDFLNTAYTVSDTVHFTPTSIRVDHATFCDIEGNTAQGGGEVNHQYFKNFDYDFAIYNIDKMLVFNATERLNPLFYGSVYGSGSATIRGNDTQTNIDVTLRTEDKTVFTFAIPQAEEVYDYQFITFVDYAERMRQSKQSKQESQDEEEEVTADLNVSLQVEATPNATMQLLVDPVMGDMIQANGSGSVRMEYDPYSDVRMYGSYIIDKGTYNFNLQDFVSRDFTISTGSTVTLKGDPMASELDIEALYTTTANLSDLDKSFAEDQELTRTNVPVQTVLDISGDMLKPDLGFSLQFPTLSQDIERRVSNIVSTEDMMNTQIIYLLALGRFYTPDYMNMGTTQNGGELASVASSTLSSQLSNMLGEISENWNIGTNIRSDKGDFSDLEMELALSSQLLNNRLIFNGNFGYQDNTTSNTTFIGDFDLEYLLSKDGNLRLKAYNHYNDRNYYIKSALTTQGVGVVFKRDFNTWSDLKNMLLNSFNSIKNWIKGKDDEENLATTTQ